MYRKPTMKRTIALALAAALMGVGCVSRPKFVNESIQLVEPPTLPCTMRNRDDLLDISDCRIVFDLSSVPDCFSLPIVAYNPFDYNTNGKSITALCPVRSILRRVLENGASRVFFGDLSVGASTLRLVPLQLGMEKNGSSVRCALSITAYLGEEKIGTFSAERTSLWGGGQTVPSCVYESASAIGDQLLGAIAGNRRLMDQIARNRTGGGNPPSMTGWSFSVIEDGGFSGQAQLDCGDWDMARAHRWMRTQIDQVALARLGVKNLDNFRIVYDGAPESFAPGKLHPIRFRVFPYRGFEITRYDSRTRSGLCRADLAYLGISESEAYERAVAFVEQVLSDQGIVKTAGMASAPVHYRFDGYRSVENGTKIEIPFTLVY